MTKLSALIALPPDQHDVFCFGVEVDIDQFLPPTSIKEIGLLFERENSQISPRVLDAIVSFSLDDVGCILELAHDDLEGIDLAHLFQIATNLTFSLSFLPPHNPSPLEEELYIQRVVSLVPLFFQQGEFSKSIYPFNSYLDYLIQNQAHPGRTYTVTDSYIKTRFIDTMSESFVERLKTAIRFAVFESVGGEEGFDALVQALIQGIGEQVKSNACDLASQTQSPSPSCPQP